jgi:hypothetical protein
MLAMSAVLVGSLGMALTQTSLYQVFGLLGLAIPAISATIGSVAFHHRAGSVVPWTYVAVGSVYYLAFSKGGTLLWLVPYVIVILSLPFTLKSTGSFRVGLLALYTTMSEVVTLNVLSIQQSDRDEAPTGLSEVYASAEASENDKNESEK